MLASTSRRSIAKCSSVALSHHLVSRLTSLVAVDVIVGAASRTKCSRRVRSRSIFRPAGTSTKCSAKRARVLERRADVVPDTLLMKLDLNATPPGAVRPQDAGLVLPQGSTPAPLMLISGIMLLLLAGALVARRRSVIAGAR